MEVMPLLTFNKPKKGGNRDKLPSGASKIHTPSLSMQGSLILPKLDSLENSFSEFIQISESPDGLQPEKVLVMEIAGQIQDLSKSLKRVPGLELLAQNLMDKEYQSELHYTVGKKAEAKPLTKNAYLTMSNLSGLKKLHSMWRNYKNTGLVEDNFAPLKHAFNQLIDIRFWNTKDRLANTFLLEDWQMKVEDAEEFEDYDQLIPFEIELWYRSSSFTRSRNEAHIRDVISRCGGSIKNSFSHEGIGYHALLGELPLSQVSKVLETASSFELMRCDEIMFFRPLGQCTAPDLGEGESTSSMIFEKPESLNFESVSPVVALFDGLPFENHEALAGRIIVDDVDDLEPSYKNTGEQIHGTSMASLIIHGDLNNPDRTSLSKPIYVRPIMAPGAVNFDGTRNEQIPSEYLPIDLIHRAVYRMKKGDGGMPPSAPDVKIINLSIGDPYRLFDSQMSPWARMLDWLSVKFDVLFVVSAGNMLHDLRLEGVKELNFRNLDEKELEEKSIVALAQQKHLRRMMSPAEAINVVTVRALHSDSYDGQYMPNQIDPFTSEEMFSPVNPISLGKKNSVKPEIMMPGGRQTYVNQAILDNDEVVLKVSNSRRFGPGLKSATPSSNKGALNTYAYTAGTSNAAAMATRRLAFLHETLVSLKEFGNEQALAQASESVVLKALLTHGAELKDSVKEALTSQLKSKENSRIFKSELNQYLGYGQVNESRIHACLLSQATLLYTGVISSDESQDYRLPLPSSLSAVTANRRLIITLAWFSPISHNHQDYRGAQLWATSGAKNVINTDDGDYYHHYLKNGTIFHEIKTGDKAASFTEGDELVIKVNCLARAGLTNIKVPYAIVVTLDALESDLPIYNEVKLGLSQQIQQTV